MRHLTVYRERALACFATAYYCVLGRDRSSFLEWLEGQDLRTLMLRGEGVPLRNGETIALEIGEEETTLFVAAYLENHSLVTNQVVIPGRLPPALPEFGAVVSVW